MKTLDLIPLNFFSVPKDEICLDSTLFRYIDEIKKKNQRRSCSPLHKKRSKAEKKNVWSCVLLGKGITLKVTNLNRLYV